MQNQNPNKRVHRYALRPRNGRQLQRDGGNRVTTKKFTAPPSKRRHCDVEDVKENDEWYRSLERPSKILRAVNHAEGSMGPNEVWESELSPEDVSDTSVALGAFSVGAFALAAERQCIACQDLLEFSGSADAAQVDDNVVNFDAGNAEAGEDVNMSMNVDAEVFSTNEQINSSEVAEALSAFAIAATYECITDQESEFVGSADAAQVDDNVVDFDVDNAEAEDDVDMSMNVDAEESSTNEQINSSEVAEADRKKRRKLQRAMALLDCKLDGRHWTEAPKRKLPRELECNLGGYWMEEPRRRRINRA